MPSPRNVPAAPRWMCPMTRPSNPAAKQLATASRTGGKSPWVGAAFRRLTARAARGAGGAHRGRQRKAAQEPPPQPRAQERPRLLVARGVEAHLVAVEQQEAPAAGRERSTALDDAHSRHPGEGLLEHEVAVPA